GAHARGGSACVPDEAPRREAVPVDDRPRTGPGGLTLGAQGPVGPVGVHRYHAATGLLGEGVPFVRAEVRRRVVHPGAGDEGGALGAVGRGGIVTGPWTRDEFFGGRRVLSGGVLDQTERVADREHGGQRRGAAG